jgi:hypothetical protein
MILLNTTLKNAAGSLGSGEPKSRGSVAKASGKTKTAVKAKASKGGRGKR